MQRQDQSVIAARFWNEPDNLDIQACGNCQGRLQIVTLAVRVDVTSLKQVFTGRSLATLGLDGAKKSVVTSAVELPRSSVHRTGVVGNEGSLTPGMTVLAGA